MVAELADAADLNPAGLRLIRVRVAGTGPFSQRICGREAYCTWLLTRSASQGHRTFKSCQIRHFAHRRAFAGALAFEQVRDWIRSLEESFGSSLLLAQQSQDVPAVSEHIGTGWEQRIVKIRRLQIHRCGRDL